MNRDERIGDMTSLFQAAFSGFSAQLWTAMPGIIQSADLTAMTCTVQPTIQDVITLQTGNQVLKTLPLLINVPVMFLSFGGLTLTIPPVAGDEVLVVFATRAIDSWWQSSGVQAPVEPRMHDLSDGFAISGFRSQPRVLTNISPTSAQLRTDDGTAYYELTKTGVANIVAPLGLNIMGPVNIMGNVATTGTLLNNTKNVGSTHQHSGVTTGTGTSGPPI